VVVFKKILAVITMILCVVFLLFCAGGAVGVWVARAPLTAAAVGLLTRTHDLLLQADTLAGDVEGGLSEVRAFVGQVQGTATGVSQAAGALKEIAPIGQLLSSLTDGTSELESRLAGIQTSSTQMRSQLGSWIAFSDLARQRAAGWITTGAIGITLVLLWFGLGQASLFVHALVWFRRPG
jgi:hypothetical protein